MTAEAWNPADSRGAEVIPLRSAHFERGDQVELAERMLTALGPERLTCDAAEVWRYSGADGTWSMVPAPKIRRLAASFAGCPVGPSRKRKDGTGEPDCLHLSHAAIKGAHSIMMDDLEADESRITFDFRRGSGVRGVAFRNGFVVVRGGKFELLPHAPENRARHAFSFDFNEDATTPKLDKFFAELFRDCSSLERDLRTACIQEFVGATLIGEATRYQRCLLIFGKGGNGKGELLRVLRGLFPPHAVTGLPPQWWGDRFRVVMLENKLANFCDELPDADIMGGESWKLVVTGDPIPMERKFRDAFMYPPAAGHIFCTNSPLRTTDHSDGFWRRPLPLALTRKFENDPGRVLEAGQAILDSEHSGLVTWALYGAARAQIQGSYTEPPSSIALRNEWRDENDQVRGFIAERPVTERIRATELYQSYAGWAKDRGLGSMSLTMFGRRLMAADLAEREDDGKYRWYAPRGTAKMAEQEEAARAALAAEEARRGG